MGWSTEILNGGKNARPRRLRRERKILARTISSAAESVRVVGSTDTTTSATNLDDQLSGVADADFKLNDLTRRWIARATKGEGTWGRAPKVVLLQCVL